jgi:hypothetical protein
MGKAFVSKLAKEGARDPEALAAWIGRRKHGKAFGKLAAAGRKKGHGSKGSSAPNAPATQASSEDKEALRIRAGYLYAAGMSGEASPQRVKTLQKAATLAHRAGHLGLEAKALGEAANISGTREDHLAAAAAWRKVAEAAKGPTMTAIYRQKADHHTKRAAAR